MTKASQRKKQKEKAKATAAAKRDEATEEPESQDEVIDEDEHELQEEEDLDDLGGDSGLDTEGDSDDDDDDDDDEDEYSRLPGDQEDILGVDHLRPWDEEVSASKKEAQNPNQKPLTIEALSAFNSRIDQSGVCYISRVPPFMKPRKLRQLLEQFAKIGRIYLAPEDPKITARRKKYRGNKRINYTEGWVEFEDKKVARNTASFLNGRNIGGKKGSRYYDDLWSIKYLPRFKWHHLTDQIAYERAVRDQKLRAEMAAAKRENKAYLRNVAKAKMIEAIEKRKAKKAQEGAADEPQKVAESKRKLDADDADDSVKRAKVSRSFRQRKPVNTQGHKELSEGQKKTLAKIFGMQ
ncbi:RNA-binding ATPase activator esf2 [Phlyctochytrium bullatum]|nr:RNA-binding ATPase activator esf2 [Phlyctochytrium bullatum]